MTQIFRGMHLQPRDLAILHEIAHARAITIAHLTGLYFEDRRPAAYKRLATLKRRGLLQITKTRLPGEQALVHLTQSGHRALGPDTIPWAIMKRRQQMNTAVVRHELDIMDVKTAFITTLRPIRTAHLERFTTVPTDLSRLCRRQHPRSPTALKPDAYLHIVTVHHDHHFFLELDRSTQSQRIIRRKAMAYRSLFRRGGFSPNSNLHPTLAGPVPFRTLVICQTANRRDSLAASLLTLVPPIRTQCWLATLADVTQCPLDPIWLTPHAVSVAQRQSSSAPALTALLPDHPFV